MRRKTKSKLSSLISLADREEPDFSKDIQKQIDELVLPTSFSSNLLNNETKIIKNENTLKDSLEAKPSYNTIQNSALKKTICNIVGKEESLISETDYTMHKENILFNNNYYLSLINKEKDIPLHNILLNFSANHFSIEDLVNSKTSKNQMNFINKKQEKVYNSSNLTNHSKTKAIENTIETKNCDNNLLENELASKLESATLKPKNKISTTAQNLKIKDVASEYYQADHKQNLNLVVIGHVDAGKSTLMGHLLHLMGEVSESKIRKFKKESENIGKKSFAYAWVLDATQEERERGVTIDVASTRFCTKKYAVNLLDAPGHRDFIPNMITGASQAEAAILVIDGAEGGFESGFDNKHSQTKEHALLVRSLGFQHLIVAINKMESTDWSQERFKEICERLSGFLCQNGYKSSNIKFVPCSGLSGINLYYKNHEKSKCIPKELSKWYTGDSIVEAIDNCIIPKRPIENPLRIPVYDYHKGGISGMSSHLIFCNGKIQQGSIQIGQRILLLPKMVEGLVKSIKINEQDVEYSICGNQVTLGIDKIDLSDFQPGSLICDPSSSLACVSTDIVCQIIVFDISIPIINGCPVVVHHQNYNIPGRIKKIRNTVNKGDGTILKKNPRHLCKKDTAVVEIKTDEPLCVDKFDVCKEMSRLLIRRSGETIATGVVLDVISDKE